MSRKDFHGGRIYSPEPADGGAPALGLRLSLAFGWAKLQLDRLLSRGPGDDGRATSRNQEPAGSETGGREAAPFEAKSRSVPLSELVSGVRFEGSVPRMAQRPVSRPEAGNR